MTKAVFLDRDGTIIPDRGYLNNVDGVHLPAANAKALRRLRDAGFLLVVVTNQSGVERGYFSADMVRRQHQRLVALAAPYGVEFSGLAFCPHAPETACDCRKPSPKMILSEADRLDIDLTRSYMIGDKLSDIQAGKRAGCAGILIADTPEPEADHTVPTLADAVSIILTHSSVAPT
ncbi:MAG: HAD family hydrolase [Lentisphaeria bacterium]|nr:HAD family hydrolase [Lentisphaeria bacterium]